MTSGTDDAVADLLRLVHPSWLRAARATERAEIARWLVTDPADAASDGADPRAVWAVRRRFATRLFTARATLARGLGPAGADALDARALRPRLRELARLQLAGVLVATAGARPSTASPREAISAARRLIGDGARPGPAAARRAYAAVDGSGPLRAPAPAGALSDAQRSLGFGLYGLACALPDHRTVLGVAHRLPRGAGRWLLDLSGAVGEADRSGPWALRARRVAFPPWGLAPESR
jgi:hypothetical protein